MNLKIRNIDYNKATADCRKHIPKIVDSYPMAITSRQVFYRLVAMGVLENTLYEYGKACRICSNLRYTGDLDWNAIIDDTRGAYKTQDWDSMEEAIQTQIEQFRFDRWADSPYYLEIHVEKRGMINVLSPTTNKYDVRIVTGGGWDSTSNVWETVQRLKEKQDKKIIIRYLGDFDPSGEQMPITAERKLREFGLDVDFKQVLLKFNHVELYNLPISFEVKAKKPSGEIYDKLAADPRAARFKDKHGKLMQVEIDSLEPDVLVQHVKDTILEYIDLDQYKDILKQEQEQRQSWLRRLE